MPTLRPRHMVTETDDVARALDAAALLWPEVQDERTELLRRIIREGARSVEQQRQSWREHRVAQIREVAGSLPNIWPSGWREELRDEWSE